MDPQTPRFPVPTVDARRGRRHRFMESADINAAFRALFVPLRMQVRRGMTNKGELYGLEMDACIPGEVLGTVWLPAAVYGDADAQQLARPSRRRATMARLLAEMRPEAMFAYVCERSTGPKSSRLYVELCSADGCHAADYPIVAGRGWHHRDLRRVAHARIAHAPPWRAIGAAG